jgi:hypothetical protein
VGRDLGKPNLYLVELGHFLNEVRRIAGSGAGSDAALPWAPVGPAGR